MADQDQTKLIYSRVFSISVLTLSVFSLILLFIGNYAWWKLPETISSSYIRLSSPFRISILIILPLILGFLGTGVFSGIILFIEHKELWNKLIFWISLGILAFNIIAAGICIIVFAAISDTWSYGVGFTGTLVGGALISLITFLYIKIQQEYFR